jgi:hypothetical protein
MKIKRIIRSEHKIFGRGILSSICHEGSEVVKTTDIMVGSVSCDRCPLRWFDFMGFVVCHTKKERKPTHKKFYKNGVPAIHLVKDEVKNV